MTNQAPVEGNAGTVLQGRGIGDIRVSLKGRGSWGVSRPAPLGHR